MPNKSVGRRFREARDKKGWTQKELADKTGFSFNYISDVECGASFPRLDRLVKLLNALDTTPNFILCDVLHKLPMDYLSELEGRLDGLSLEKRHKVLAILEFLIEQELKEEQEEREKQEQSELEVQKEIDKPTET